MGEEKLPPLHCDEGRVGRKPGGHVATSLRERLLELSYNGIILDVGVAIVKRPQQGYDSPCHKAVGMEQRTKAPF